MKAFLLLFSFILIAYKEAVSSPSPSPDNDVHFHVNMAGSGKKYPLKSGKSKNHKQVNHDLQITIFIPSKPPQKDDTISSFGYV